MLSKRISLIMPIYIKNEQLKQLTREAIFSMQGQYDELIIIDDASPLPVGFVKEYATTIISHQKNMGFTKSVNDGIRVARGDYILCTNNDIRLEKGKLSDMFWGANRGYSFPRFVKKQSPIWDGAFFMMSRQTLEKNGFLDERYKSYFSDTDLFWRAMTNDLLIHLVEKMLVFHWENMSHSDIREKAYEADRKLFIKKWGFDALQNRLLYP